LKYNTAPLFMLLPSSYSANRGYCLRCGSIGKHTIIFCSC